RNPGDSPQISGHMWVPIDDYNTMVYNWTVLPPGERERRAETEGRGAFATRRATPDADGNLPVWYRDAQLRVGAGNEFGADVDVNAGFRSTANRSNRYQIDRQVQKTQTYTGIPGVNTQDRAVQESMGAIADRTLERLGTTDRAIITTRRLLLNAIAAVEQGKQPPGVDPSYYELRPGEKILAKGTSWMEAFGLIEAVETPVG